MSREEYHRYHAVQDVKERMYGIMAKRKSEATPWRVSKGYLYVCVRAPVLMQEAR